MSSYTIIDDVNAIENQTNENDQNEAVTQRSYMPTIHQRRLWQKERNLEEDVKELNLLIASYYSSEREAAKRIFEEKSIRIMYRLKISMPATKFWCRVLDGWTKVQRSKRFEKLVLKMIRLVIWIQKHRW